jgi:hypothetical protein
MLTKKGLKHFKYGGRFCIFYFSRPSITFIMSQINGLNAELSPEQNCPSTWFKKNGIMYGEVMIV